MFRLFNTIFPFTDFAYILQLEEYDAGRYAKWLRRFFLRRNIQMRQKLAYTPRALVLLAVSIALYAALVMALLWLAPLVVAIVSIVAATVAIPLIVGATNLILAPAFAFAHARMRTRAAVLLAARRAQLTVVMVAGSYGKTTTKHFIEALAKHQFRVQVPPGNINTPAGIAGWITRALSPLTTLFIVEADGYNKREYAQTVAMAPADIAVITNIGDQHLERFGTRKKLAEALAEVFIHSRERARLITTAAVAQELKDMARGDRSLHTIDAGLRLEYHDTALDAEFLSASQREDLRLALEVADSLRIPIRFVVDAVSSLAAPERRQARGVLFGYDAIDDSYNISLSTANASVRAARALAVESGKRLLVITAGIPELGREVADGNTRLGALLGREADHTVVLGSMFAKDIVQGIGTADYTAMPTLTAFQARAHAKWNPKEWALLLLPELNDLYY